MNGPRRSLDVVALGGGHGLAASLKALRRVTSHLTAVVGVSDNGGSSGRLRDEFGIVPPGDLRMALAALCGDDDWGATWARVLQHRFASTGTLAGHSLGNLLIAALWEETGDIVAGLDWVGRLLDARGQVLPLSLLPLEVVATVQTPAGDQEVVGQVQVATCANPIKSIRLNPPSPPACPAAVAAVQQADAVVLGPGSWFTSVLTHFEVPQMAQALATTPAQRVLILNLVPQIGETDDFGPEHYLEVLANTYPEFRVDCVIADPNHVADVDLLLSAARGAEVILQPVASTENPAVHDVQRLAQVLGDVFARARI